MKRQSVGQRCLLVELLRLQQTFHPRAVPIQRKLHLVGGCAVSAHSRGSLTTRICEVMCAVRERHRVQSKARDLRLLILSAEHIPRLVCSRVERGRRIAEGDVVGTGTRREGVERHGGSAIEGGRAESVQLGLEIKSVVLRII